MSDIVRKALLVWGLDGASWSLAAQRENAVYRVIASGRPFALRIRRQGYRTDPEIHSELAWMAAMGAAGLRVPEPVASLEGRAFEVIDGRRVDLVSWLPGEPLGHGGATLAHADRLGVLRAAGRVAAELHRASDAWQPPAGFTRAAWDCDGLLGAAPQWGRFWENPSLPPEIVRRLTAFRAAAEADLQDRGDALDYGLIHADLVGENVLIDHDGAALIDFDDGGPGYRLFELATLLNRLRRETDYNELRDAMIAGYRDIRPLDTGALDLMIALRAVSYLGWIAPRLHEPGAEARLARFVPSALTAIDAYFGQASQADP